MERVAHRLGRFLVHKGHVIAADQSSAEIEIRLNGCPASCLDEADPPQDKGRVLSLSAAHIDLNAPDEEALIQWLRVKIEEMTR